MPQPIPTAALTVRLLTLLLIAAAATGLTPPAAAHSDLVASTPADGTSLEALPARVELQFNQDIAPQFAAVTLTPVDTGSAPATLQVSVSGPMVTAEVPASLQAAPSWRLGYRVTSADGHPIEGTIDFNVKESKPTPDGRASPGAGPSAAPTPGSTSPSEPPSSSGENGSPWSSTVLIGLIAAIGTAGALVLLRRRAEEE
jgi:copper resistance protein C